MGAITEIIPTASIKSILRQSAAAYYCSGLRHLAHRGKVIILIYHRVPEDGHPNFVQPGMYVKASVFERHIAFLKAHYEVISFHKLLEMWEWKSGEMANGTAF